jgi:hypothetical protein
VLWAGSQFAHDRGQSVEWYTGFGQWLGGLGSLTAAIVALWIATRDRKERERELRSADRAQATLVIVELGQPEGQEGQFPVIVTNYARESRGLPVGLTRQHRKVYVQYLSQVNAASSC